MNKLNKSIQDTFERWDEVKKALEEREILTGEKYPEMLQVAALLTVTSVLEAVLAELRAKG